MKKRSIKKQPIAQFYRGNILAFSISIFAALATGSLNLILSWFTQQLVDAASGAENALPLYTLLKLIVGFIILCVGIKLLDYIAHPLYLKRAIQQYKDYAFNILVGKSISSFRDESTAAYVSALTNDTTSMEVNYLGMQLSMITMLVTFLGALIMMFCTSPLLTVISIGVTILPLIASLLTGGKLEAAEVRVSDCNRNFTAALHDCLSGFSVVKSFKAEKEIYELFKKNNQALEKQKFSRERIKVMVGMIGAVTGIFAQLSVFLAGAYLAAAGKGLTAGTVILFVNLMNFTIQPVAVLPGLLANRKAALGLVGKLADALEKNPTACGNQTISEISHGIELKNVCFGYEEGREVLHNISTKFEEGKSYAIVGGSGSGKSTLLNLLMASDSGYKGSILLDGIELKDIAPEALYDVMSAIQQNVFVFNASIKDNVSMFREFPKSELDNAIDKAHLRELVTERGEEYLCGENGNGLSGGEKQRISIARSLLRKSSVLLVDEATAALDAKTAHEVSDNILDISGITRIVVTHTLDASQMRRYDEILVLKNGQITESGSFDELMERKEYFYALFTVAQ